MKQKQKILIIAVLSLIILFVVAGKLYKNQQYTNEATSIANNASSLIRSTAIKKGPDDAKVKIVEFFDPACGTCASFYPLVEEILQKNEGKIQLIMRYAPFHKGSMDVVRILEAARAQNKFFQTLEVLFTYQSTWANGHAANMESVWRLLPRAGLDIDVLVQDLRDPKIDATIKQDLDDIETLGIHQTPEYFVNTRPLVKFGFKELVELIDEELRK